MSADSVTGRIVSFEDSGNPATGTRIVLEAAIGNPSSRTALRVRGDVRDLMARVVRASGASGLEIGGDLMVARTEKRHQVAYARVQ